MPHDYTHTYRLDRGEAEVLLCDVSILDLWRETFLNEVLQQCRVVRQGALRRRLGDPVCLGQQVLSSAVEVRGEKQLRNGRFEVLLVILVFVKWLMQLHRNIL